MCTKLCLCRNMIVHVIRFNLPPLCVCPKARPEFPTPYVVVFLCSGIPFYQLVSWDRRGRDRLVLGFTAYMYAITVYHH